MRTTTRLFVFCSVSARGRATTREWPYTPPGLGPYRGSRSNARYRDSSEFRYLSERLLSLSRSRSLSRPELGDSRICTVVGAQRALRLHLSHATRPPSTTERSSTSPPPRQPSPINPEEDDGAQSRLPLASERVAGGDRVAMAAVKAALGLGWYWGGLEASGALLCLWARVALLSFPRRLLPLPPPPATR